MVSEDVMMFHSIVNDRALPTFQEAGVQVERRRSFRRPLGAIATVARVFAGQEQNRLAVLLTNRSHDGVGLRSPIGLVANAIYRLQVGSETADSLLVRILTSRPRDDGTFDIGATCA